ncbi:MAG: hypothetical protein RL088_3097 [Verrucomicrobiota bacterium]|jgi:outer membrane protein assembly factor BamB
MKHAAALLFLATIAAHAADWPRFRGVDGSGNAGDAKAPATWNDSENLKWKTALPGPGSSSPIVWKDRVFVTCYSGYGDGSDGAMEKLQRHLVSLERATGKVVWSKSVAAEMPEDSYGGFLTEHGYASNTPVTDGERVYAFFGKTGVVAFDFDGCEVWRVNVGKESGNRRWGSGASLMLVGDKVIVNASEESQSIRALDKATGREVWKAPSASLELCYSTPVAMNVGDRTDIVLAVPGELWGMNPDTGKLRWFAETRLSGNVSPSVLIAGGMIYVNGGFPRLGAAAVKAGGKGDVTESAVVWSSQNASYVPSPVISDGHLYVANDQGFALCLNAKDGSLVYKERLPGASATGRGGKPFYASAVIANGLVYAVSRQNGTFVFDAKPTFKLVAHNKLAADSSQFNGTPAIVDGQIFLRSDRAIYCIEAAAK